MKRLVVLLVSIALFHCSHITEVAGGSSDSGNPRITGTALNAKGLPAAGAQVRLRRADYVRSPNIGIRKIMRESKDALTDANGSFAIDSLDTGAYCIEVNDGDSNAALFRATIAGPNDSVNCPSDTLKPTGSIKVIVPALSVMSDIYVQVYGLDRLAKRDVLTGDIIVSNVPKGNYSIRVLSVSLDSAFKELKGLSVVSGKQTDMGTVDPFFLQGWRFSKAVYFNTTALGANVSGNVSNFPVLIRLTSSNFNFSQVQSNGADIRFSKADNTVLPHEIEQWDAANQRAEVWVKVDTIRGNDSNQAITMHWGASTTSTGLVTDASNSAAVFDTSNGFKGVWHLAESASALGTAGSYKDATSNHFNGDNFVSSANPSGIIGRGVGFNGINDYIHINSGVTNFVSGDFTISLWVNISRAYGGSLLLKGNDDTLWERGEWCFYFGSDTTFNSKITWTSAYNGLFPSFVGYNNSYAIAGTQVTSQTWHHLTYTWKWGGDTSGISRWFIDGKEVALSIADVVYKNYNDSASTIWIGRGNNNEAHENFAGSMDELEIAGIVRSSDWIKLCYMSQRSDDKLIVFK